MSEHPVYFFFLIKKSNKKNQSRRLAGRKMAKKYCVTLKPGETRFVYSVIGKYHGLGQPRVLGGLLRNFLNAIFLRPPPYWSMPVRLYHRSVTILEN
jgi:hypothetical protein